MKGQYDYELIRDYLLGLTDQQTTREVAELIRKDEFARDIAAGILRLEKEFNGNEEEIDRYLDKFMQSQLRTIQTQSRTGRNGQKFWLRIAASVVFVVAAGYFITVMINRPDTGSFIAAELSEPYPVSNIFRSEGGASDEDKGYAAYADKNYREAAQYFSKLPDGSQNAGSVSFYLALSNLYMEQYENAIVLFESVSISESRYEQQALWYKSLALLKANDQAKAQKILLQIAEDQRHFKHAEAQQLLSLLE
jgi:hypothetical protein